MFNPEVVHLRKIKLLLVFDLDFLLALGRMVPQLVDLEIHGIITVVKNWRNMSVTLRNQTDLMLRPMLILFLNLPFLGFLAVRIPDLLEFLLEFALMFLDNIFKLLDTRLYQSGTP